MYLYLINKCLFLSYFIKIQLFFTIITEINSVNSLLKKEIQ